MFKDMFGDPVFRSDILQIILLFVVIILVVGIGVNQLQKVSCSATTQDMGFDHRYSFAGGCQIEVNPGQWIPLDSYYFKQE